MIIVQYIKKKISSFIKSYEQFKLNEVERNEGENS